MQTFQIYQFISKVQSRMKWSNVWVIHLFCWSPVLVSQARGSCFGIFISIRILLPSAAFLLVLWDSISESSSSFLHLDCLCIWQTVVYIRDFNVKIPFLALFFFVLLSCFEICHTTSLAKMDKYQLDNSPLQKFYWQRRNLRSNCDFLSWCPPFLLKSPSKLVDVVVVAKHGGVHAVQAH